MSIDVDLPEKFIFRCLEFFDNYIHSQNAFSDKKCNGDFFFHFVVLSFLDTCLRKVGQVARQMNGNQA